MWLDNFFYAYIYAAMHMYNFHDVLGVIKRNPLFLHEIEWKNNGFLFITRNI